MAANSVIAEDSCFTEFTKFNMCKKARELSDGMANMLPMKISQNMAWESVASFGKTIQGQIRLGYTRKHLEEQYKKSGLPISQAKQAMEKSAHNICKQEDPAARAFIGLGGNFRYIYSFIDGEHFITIDINNCDENKKDKDYISYIKRLAAEGNSNAQFDLASAFYVGRGVPKDYAYAFKWFKKASEQGHTESQFNLAQMYRQGLAVSKNYKLAFKWFMRSAKEGYAKSQNSVAVMYGKGLGVSKNHKLAFEWYKKAAAQGHPHSQNNLAYSYLKGIGTSINHKLAFKWYQKAAEQSEPNAEYSLAAMYARGSGTARDYVLAYMWATIASSRKTSGSIKLKKLLSKKMSRQQKSKAVNLANEWLKNH